jgi:hypothetical protein
MVLLFHEPLLEPLGLYRGQNISFTVNLCGWNIYIQQFQYFTVFYRTDGATIPLIFVLNFRSV